MKNNTKLIMETWRRFLNEGDQNEEGQYSDPDETVPPLPPVEEDPDLVDDIKKIDSVEEKENYKKNQPGFCKFFIAWEKTAIVVGTFLSWPTVVQKILEVMNCEKIGEKY